ncbi:MAG: tRNA preQ1(34) S-adenosylmethionine ribosyltransferase-isomerase QueA [Nitrospirae bacterium]|nr:tRNA preQ1(34) S-adenosylmethionine ribosyltransferase-isomerase QueA [Nitrospirota bacterium]
METADYDFFLPERLIAVRPVEKRDLSRLLVMRKDGRMEHLMFRDLPSLLSPGDLLVLNNTKVFPARLTGVRPDGGRMEILLVGEISPNKWNMMIKGRYSGPVIIDGRIPAYISGGKVIEFESNIRDEIWNVGRMPLPPYIPREPDGEDISRYQTVYAEVEGSIAAPTAGLHFTEALLDEIRSRGISVRTVTLHVGVGTFRPVKSATVGGHTMESEYFDINPGLIEEIERTKKMGRRIIAVGTTTTRALEGYTSGDCRLEASNGSIHGSTGIFIHEGYTLKTVDSLITNFHLPRSTPLMLASVFCGRERLLGAYRDAVAIGYRFFSYGDAMLFL